MIKRRRDPHDLQEGQRLLQILRIAMTVVGVTPKEVQRRLGLSTGYMTRLLRGAFEIKVEHLLSIARVLGLAPAELFFLAYPKRPEPPSRVARAVQRTLEGPPPVPPELTPERFQDLIDKLQRATLSFGAELKAVLDELGGDG
jgi:transcriptional regulator with XRE-family HTH domain